MSTPRRHLSIDELSHRASTGLAIRRGEVKISDPIPSSYRHNGAEMDAGAFEHPEDTPKAAVTWSGKSTGGHIGGKNDGTQPNAHISRFTERTSLGPSIAISNMSSTHSKDSTPQKRSAGLRATIRRMFSSKKDKTANLPRRAESLMVCLTFSITETATNEARTQEEYFLRVIGNNKVCTILHPRIAVRYCQGVLYIHMLLQLHCSSNQHVYLRLVAKMFN